MTLNEQIAFCEAFIELWDVATQPANENSDTQTELLQQVFHSFCETEKLPQLSADDLLGELTGIWAMGNDPQH